jgi:hypothetical protein
LLLDGKPASLFLRFAVSARQINTVIVSESLLAVNDAKLAQITGIYETFRLWRDCSTYQFSYTSLWKLEFHNKKVDEFQLFWYCPAALISDKSIACFGGANKPR